MALPSKHESTNFLNVVRGVFAPAKENSLNAYFRETRAEMIELSGSFIFSSQPSTSKQSTAKTL
jgi:hypothetical protein